MRVVRSLLPLERGPAGGLRASHGHVRSWHWLVLALFLAQPMLGVGAALPPENDAGSGGDAPDAPDPSFMIEQATRYRGSLPTRSDAADWYALVVPESENELAARFWSVDQRCPRLYDAGHRPVPWDTCDLYFGAHTAFSWRYPTAPGLYFLEVQRVKGDLSLNDPHYEFAIDFDPAYPFLLGGDGSYPHDDAKSARDAQGHWGSDVAPPPDMVHKGRLWSVFDDEADWYLLFIDGAERIQVRLASMSLPCPLLYNADGVQPTRCRQVDAGTWVMDAALAADGRHYIIINPTVRFPVGLGGMGLGQPSVDASPYRFSYALDGEAPDPIT